MSHEYLSMFVEETREHLQAWSDGMISMEKTNDSAAVATLFRAAHTIKGMAMTMGFQRMGEITHNAENLLDDIRNNRLTIGREVVDALLQALDLLEGLLNDVEQTGVESAIDITPMVRLLNSVKASAGPRPAQSSFSGSTAATLRTVPKNGVEQTAATAVAVRAPTASDTTGVIRQVAEAAMEKGYRVYEIRIGFEPGCVMPLARFAQWLQRIDSDNILFTDPESAVIDAGDYRGDITVVYATTEDFERIGATLADVSEIVIHSVAEWTHTEGRTYIRGESLLPKQGPITDDAHVRKVIQSALSQDIRVYEVAVLLSPACQMKSARLYMVFDAVGGQNRLLYTAPHIELIEQEKMDRHCLFVMWSREDIKTVQRAVESVSEVELVELREWAGEGQELSRGANLIPPPAAKSNEKMPAAHERKKMSTVRVDTEKLDDLMNLVSELAIDKTRLERIRADLEHPGLSETVDHMSRLSSQLQELIMSIRMVPVETVFNRFPRMVRDTAHQLGKTIEFAISGQETELDRTVVEEIGDPIMHMLRNSLDHGIESTAERRARGKPEQGRIELRAYAAGNHVFIEVEDDGGGINREKVLKRARERGILGSGDHPSDNQIYQLLFAPGFSTADQISDLSGRGVGLDVVKSKIESLSGKVDISSEEGRGTKFVVRLPMTLAIMDGLMVKVSEHPYLIPIGSITETGVLRDAQTLHGQEVVVWRKRVVPIVRARAVFGESPSDRDGYVVFVNRSEKVVGIVVDELIGQFEVVLKTLDQRLKKIPYFAGATILGDGEVSLIIDANSFID